MTRALLTFSLLLWSAPAYGQERESHAMLDAWGHLQRHVLAVLDSATPAMLGFRPAPGVRTFAEQIHHVNEVIVRITSAAVARQPMPRGIMTDTATTLHDLGQLRAETERVFDFLFTTLAAVPDSAFGELVPLAGGSMPRWRWNLTALQHSAWTLGQTVPYLRMNGRRPPPFTPF